MSFYVYFCSSLFTIVLFFVKQVAFSFPYDFGNVPVRFVLLFLCGGGGGGQREVNKCNETVRMRYMYAMSNWSCLIHTKARIFTKRCLHIDIALQVKVSDIVSLLFIWTVVYLYFLQWFIALVFLLSFVSYWERSANLEIVLLEFTPPELPTVQHHLRTSCKTLTDKL